MRIYLASRFSNRFILRNIRDFLVKSGHQIVSRWIDVPSRPEGEIELFWGVWALKDVQDLDSAECLILVTIGCDGESAPRGGMRFEEGYCYAQKKPIYVVGPKLIVFDQLKDICYCSSIEELMNIFKAG